MENELKETAERGHGRGTGRGRGRGRGPGGRGRGRGRGAAQSIPHSSVFSEANASTEPSGETSTRPPREPKPRLTHFIALPIGHHVRLREKMSKFTDALLATKPPIPGLDSTVVIPPRRLHFTLGVMSLDDAPSMPGSTTGTLEDAKKVLDELKPKIKEILRDEALKVKLDSVDIMPPEKRDQERAHVMWVGPSLETESAKRLKTVADLIVREFNEAGLLVDENRPLKVSRPRQREEGPMKLHCTVVNTIYRRPRGKMRTPFSYPCVLASEAFKAVQAGERGELEESGGGKQRRRPVPVELGEWTIDEVQICEMGSWGPEGEYVAVHRCVLA
ncbi:AKAP7 2'5' RNA ligase-like domain-containing protein [Cubamyces lactineus]|nr:AKAP7 2'5' RNA ligase-like domain-containing protein [Cubamyces lactineus]